MYNVLWTALFAVFSKNLVGVPLEFCLYIFKTTVCVFPRVLHDSLDILFLIIQICIHEFFMNLKMPLLTDMVQIRPLEDTRLIISKYVTRGVCSAKKKQSTTKLGS